MEVRLRNLETSEVLKIDTLAKKNKMSRDKFITHIIKNYLESEIKNELNKKFFDDEISKIVDVIKENNKVIDKAYDVLSRGL